MWASPCLSPPTPPLLHPSIPKPRLNTTVVSAKSHSQPAQDLGGLGRTILTQVKSNTKPINLGKQKKDEGSSSRQISGSDVLFAMQKAAATKKRREKKKKTSKRESSSVGRYMGEEEERVDYSNVRDLCVKSDWGTRLDELEMRFQELSSKLHHL